MSNTHAIKFIDTEKKYILRKIFVTDNILSYKRKIF